MKRPLHVAIIGAGMSGLYLAYRLREVGIDFTIYELRPAVGGTWHDNTYPGLHVDVITRRYEFPFARASHYTKRYAPGSEITTYLSDFAREQGLLTKTRFNTEVTSAVYRDGLWDLVLNGTEHVTADAVVAATGFLRVPNTPDFPGQESFEGPSFHSSQWDHSIDMVGKRVGVVGTGSSAIQIVSALAMDGVDVTQFIRNPHWIQVKENPRISAFEKFTLRFSVFARYWDWRMRRLRIKTDGTETWKITPGPDRDAMTDRFLATLEEEIPDPVLRAKLTPTDPLGCKRIPKSPDYYRSIQLPNAHPVFSSVAEVRPNGILDGDGVFHELDVIVYATGFDTHAYMRPMSVTGADGMTVEELWKDGVYSFRGVALPSMPNFFMLCGPFAPVNSLAVPGCLQDECDFLTQVLDVSRTDDVALAPTAAATSEFVNLVRSAIPNTTFALCDNWYTDQSGTPVIWPFAPDRHHSQLETLDLSEFDLFPVVNSDLAAPNPA